MNKQIKFLIGAMALALCGTASAATEWTLIGPPPAGLAISAYANTGGTNNSSNSANNGALQTIQSATWVSEPSWSGIKNADACGSGLYCDVNEGNHPEHSIDNNQRYDMALLSFAQQVKITDVKLSWKSNDSDITVMAYTGVGAPTLVGNTYNQLVGLGWTSIGNYSDLVQNVNKAVNGGGVSSSYWLIGAHNPLANPGGGSVTGGNPTSSSTFDYVKLASVTTTPGGKVPLPSTLMLLGVGLLGMLTMRKRQAV